MPSPQVSTGEVTPVGVTVGVAVAVPEPYASELRHQRAAFGDARAGSVPTHITLHPPTTLQVEALREVREHCALVAGKHPPFGVRLRGTGTFRPVSPVVFIAVAQGISECELLAQDVRSGPLAQEAAFPYHPHVTVAHDVGADQLDCAFDTLADYACSFTVDTFTLYVHDTLAGWRPDTVFALAPGSSG